MQQVLKTMLENVRAKTPLVHNITNYVTVNDVANVLLAAGGSPIMSDDADDVEDITSICGGLNINIGTLNKNTIPSMFLAGKKANALGHIVLLDPVGAGASRLRTDTANRLMQEVRFDAVRGNISEIKTLCTGSGSTKGVDADAVDAVTEANLDDGVALVKAFAKQTGCIIAVTGNRPRAITTTRSVSEPTGVAYLPASLITGTIRPRSVSTAMPRCSAPWKTMFFSSMDALTIGNAFSASTAAFEMNAR